MGKAFMISGGGVGAKTVEAVVHLCAAGWGPDELHILLIDPDTNNGNLKRAVDTIKDYTAIQAWPWTVRSDDKAPEPLSLFRTRIFRYDLTAPVESMKDGGLAAAAYGKPDLAQLLELLYDPEERTTQCLDGFRARPNLGCLVLSDHIQKHLAVPTGYRAPLEPVLLEQGGAARDFVMKLGEALNGNELCPVAVVGSVFGGMGASLHPIIEKLICDALTAKHYGNQDKLRWAFLMMLPYFMPRSKESSVDPNRYLLDTSIALQFYDLSQWVQHRLVYLVGAWDPGDQGKQVATNLGSREQMNPAFVEEAVGALGALQFMAKPPDQQSPGTMVWAVPAGTMDLSQLPDHDAQRSGRTLRQLLAYLLHLGAFFLRGGNGQPGHAQGLYHFIAGFKKDPGQLLQVGWYDDILHKWAETMKDSILPLAHLKSSFLGFGKREAEAKVLLGQTEADPHLIAPGSRLAAAYFGRLLYWADMVFAKADAQMVRFGAEVSNGYPSIHDTMCSIPPEYIQLKAAAREYEPQEDNAMGRILRAAVVAMLREHELGAGVSPDLKFGPFTDQAARQIQLYLKPDEISRGLQDVLGTDLATTLYQDYWPPTT